MGQMEAQSQPNLNTYVLSAHQTTALQIIATQTMPPATRADVNSATRADVNSAMRADVNSAASTAVSLSPDSKVQLRVPLHPIRESVQTQSNLDATESGKQVLSGDGSISYTFQLQNMRQSFEYSTILPFDALLTDFYVLFFQPETDSKTGKALSETSFYGALAQAPTGKNVFTLMEGTFTQASLADGQIWEAEQHELNLLVPRNTKLLFVAGGYDQKQMNLVNTGVIVSGSLALLKKESQ
jgi:hypothetical protein